MAGIGNPARVLRDEARRALLGAGGRGFVRFLPEGEALLVSDAPRRCVSPEEAERLTDAITRAGFVPEWRDGFLLMTPTDERLRALAAAPLTAYAIDWDSPLHPAAALAARWRRERETALSESGRSLVIETLRLAWQMPERVLAGLPGLRARAARMLREGDRSGFAEAGAILNAWLQSLIEIQSAKERTT